MSEETVEKDVDYMPVVRAIVKMSSALNDADNVVDGKYFKFDFKVKFREWLEIFEVSSKPLIDAFLKDSETAFQEAYTTFVEAKKDVKIKNEEKTSLIILYCQLQSAFNDLDELSFEDGGLMTFLIKKQTFKVLEAIKKQYGDIFSIKDSQNKTINAIVEDYDSLGKTMFVKK